MKTLSAVFCLFFIGALAQNNQVQVAEEYGTLTQDQIGLASSIQAVDPLRGDVGNPEAYMGQGNMLMTGMQNQMMPQNYYSGMNNQMMMPQYDPMSGMMPQNNYMYQMPPQPYPMLPQRPGRCNNMNFRCPLGRSCYPRPPTPRRPCPSPAICPLRPRPCPPNRQCFYPQPTMTRPCPQPVPMPQPQPGCGGGGRCGSSCNNGAGGCSSGCTSSCNSNSANNGMIPY